MAGRLSRDLKAAGAATKIYDIGRNARSIRNAGMFMSKGDVLLITHRLRAASERARRHAIKRAAKHGAMRMAEEIQKEIDRKGLVKSSVLRESIGIQPVKMKKKHAEILVGPLDITMHRTENRMVGGKLKQVSVKSFPSLYGKWLEEGTSKMEPKRFMGDALDRAGGQVLKEMKAVAHSNVIRAI